MAFKIKYSEQSSKDLADIMKYISDELCNPKAAERFYMGVADKIKLLRENPYLFPLYPDEKLSTEGFHFAAVGNYLMFYIIDDSKSIVNIVRLLYGRRNIPEIV